MGPKRLKGPKRPPLQGIRLGPACSGSLKSSAQFREVGNTLPWTSLVKTEAGSPFSSIFSVLKPVWKQHRKTSVTRMSGWVREQGGRALGPGIKLELRESAQSRTMNCVERVRDTPCSPQLQSKPGPWFHSFTILANSKSLQQGRPCELLRPLWSCRAVLSSPLLLGRI